MEPESLARFTLPDFTTTTETAPTTSTQNEDDNGWPYTFSGSLFFPCLLGFFINVFTCYALAYFVFSVVHSLLNGLPQAFRLSIGAAMVAMCGVAVGGIVAIVQPPNGISSSIAYGWFNTIAIAALLVIVHYSFGLCKVRYCDLSHGYMKFD